MVIEEAQWTLEEAVEVFERSLRSLQGSLSQVMSALASVFSLPAVQLIYSRLSLGLSSLGTHGVLILILSV